MCIRQDTTYTDILLGEERRGARSVIRESKIRKMKQMPIISLILKRHLSQDKRNKHFGTAVSWGSRLGLLGEDCHSGVTVSSQTSEMLDVGGKDGGRKRSSVLCR